MPKQGVNDPQGEAIRNGLGSLEFREVEEVRAGKRIVITVDADSEHDARNQGERMCEQLLANPVIESYTLAVAQVNAATAGPES
jgi:phosphoribosylformylglycinamidine synthase